MANALKTIDQAIKQVQDSIPKAGMAESVELEQQKVLLNFLDELRVQIKEFCFTWTGKDTFDDPPLKKS